MHTGRITAESKFDQTRFILMWFGANPDTQSLLVGQLADVSVIFKDLSSVWPNWWGDRIGWPLFWGLAT